MTPKTVDIGGRQVTITRCSATQALDLQLALAKVVGDVDVGLLMDDKVPDTVKASEAMGILTHAAKSLTLAELTRIMLIVLQHTMIDGKKFKGIDEDFADRPLDLWQAFIEGLKHNLGPLVAGLLRSSSPAATPTG